jgi:P-type Cu+ transporter
VTTPGPSERGPSEPGGHVVDQASEQTFAVTGMTCSNCSLRLERVLSTTPGVRSATVDLVTETATARFAASEIELAGIVQAIERAGFGASLKARDAPASTEAAAVQKRLPSANLELRVAIVCTLPLLVFSMLPMISMRIHHLAPGFFRFMMGYGALLLAAPVQFFSARKFYLHAWAEVRGRLLGMNTLVALGSSAAFAQSTFALFLKSSAPSGDTYFEAAASIVVFVLLGKSLEQRAVHQATVGLHRLSDFAPRSVTRLEAPDDREVPCKAEDLRVGDRIVVRPGDRFAVDGVVTSGSADVDEAVINGESMPVRKHVGSEVTSGSLCLDARLVVKATRVQGETTLAQMQTALLQAAREKPAIQRRAESVAAWFVPLVLLGALCTFCGWLLVAKDWQQALSHATSVLVIACPCAVGLATPMAIAVACGIASERGFLIRKAAALETFAKVDTVLLDKTGTVTEGKPKVTRTDIALGQASKFWALTQALAASSTHPLSKALVIACKTHATVESSDPELTDITVVGGGGVQALTISEGKPARVALGSYAFALGRTAPGPTSEDATKAETGVWISLDGKPVGTFWLRDPVAKDSAASIRSLKQRGIQIALVSGDQAGPAESAAAEVGIATVLAKQSPADKAAYVEGQMRMGRIVAFVGDGINDAAALARSHVGVAMGSGTGVAQAQADIVLMGQGLSALPTAHRLAQCTLRTIRQNLGFSLVYNILLAPLASGLLLPWWGIRLSPGFAALAMSLSSISVVANSLLLRWRMRT